MDAIISVKNLRKVYKIGPEKVVALNSINLDIFKGEVCCILGTSGSGKSTLLNQLAGLEKPTKGQVTIGKTNISKLSEDGLARFRQKNIGFIFQSYNLMTALTALENVSMPLMFRGMERRKREKIAAQMLKDVGLSERIHHRPSQMSGGQQQRVGIARAFVARPKIVFADEPTGNLDSRTTIEVMEMMVRMSRENNQTMILVTHDRELAEYADRIITLIDGSIVSDVKNISLLDRTDEQRVQSKLDKAHVQMEIANAAHKKLSDKTVVANENSDYGFAPTDIIEDEIEEDTNPEVVEAMEETTAEETTEIETAAEVIAEIETAAEVTAKSKTIAEETTKTKTAANETQSEPKSNTLDGEVEITGKEPKKSFFDKFKSQKSKNTAKLLEQVKIIESPKATAEELQKPVDDTDKNKIHTSKEIKQNDK